MKKGNRFRLRGKVEDRQRIKEHTAIRFKVLMKKVSSTRRNKTITKLKPLTTKSNKGKIMTKITRRTSMNNSSIQSTSSFIIRIFTKFNKKRNIDLRGNLLIHNTRPFYMNHHYGSIGICATGSRGDIQLDLGEGRVLAMANGAKREGIVKVSFQ